MYVKSNVGLMQETYVDLIINLNYAFRLFICFNYGLKVGIIAMKKKISINSTSFSNSLLNDYKLWFHMCTNVIKLFVHQFVNSAGQLKAN